MKSLFSKLLFLVPIFAISACNTMEGAGQDLKAGGKKIEKEAEQNKNY